MAGIIQIVFALFGGFALALQAGVNGTLGKKSERLNRSWFRLRSGLWLSLWLSSLREMEIFLK
jgi:uncharacterized membrane protein YdcZ (DUF606 family)